MLIHESCQVPTISMHHSLPSVFQHILYAGRGGDLPAGQRVQPGPGLRGQDRGHCRHPRTLHTAYTSQAQWQGTPLVVMNSLTCL